MGAKGFTAGDFADQKGGGGGGLPRGNVLGGELVLAI